MTTVLAAITLTLGITGTWETPTADPYLDGLATYMAQNVMEQTAVNRALIEHPDDLPLWLTGEGLVCAVALNRRADLGRIVWLRQPDGPTLGPCLSIDCAALPHFQRRIDQERVVEVGWRIAQHWGMEGPIPIRVLFYNPHLHRVKVYEPR